MYHGRYSNGSRMWHIFAKVLVMTNDNNDNTNTTYDDGSGDGWIPDTLEAEDQRVADIAEREAAREAGRTDDDVVVEEDRQPERNTISRYAGDTVRVTLRIPSDLKARLQFFADRRELSMSEYMAFALENQFARDNGHFDGETLMSSRINAHSDVIEGLKHEVRNLSGTVQALMHMMSTLVTGETDLLDISDEDGEI